MNLFTCGSIKQLFVTLLHPVHTSLGRVDTPNYKKQSLNHKLNIGWKSLRPFFILASNSFTIRVVWIISVGAPVLLSKTRSSLWRRGKKRDVKLLHCQPEMSLKQRPSLFWLCLFHGQSERASEQWLRDIDSKWEWTSTMVRKLVKVSEWTQRAVSLLPPQVIRGLLKFWPKTCSQKEVKLAMTSVCLWTLGLCKLCLCASANALLLGCRAGDVSRRIGGNPGRHRTNTVRQDPGAALQTDLQMCLQPTLPGQWPPSTDDLSGFKDWSRICVIYLQCAVESEFYSGL